MGTGLRQLELCPGLADEVRAGCGRNEAFLVLHAAQAEALGQLLNVPAERFAVVGSGFRETVFHGKRESGPRQGAIAYAGKLSEAKGVPSLLDAVDVLAKQIPGLELHVAGAGTGEEAEAIRRRIAATEHVVFHGQLSPEYLAQLLRESAVFVLPSFFEGLPLVLVEAAACGCRLVATELPGVVSELAPRWKDRLELVPLPRMVGADRPVQADLPRFVDNLAAAIEKSLARPMVEAGDEVTKAMTWSAVFRRIETVWKRLIADG